MEKIIILLDQIEEFDSLIKGNNFFEYAKIFDNYYGTLKEPVLKFLSAGKDVLFDIDWQGTQQLKKLKFIFSYFFYSSSKYSSIKK